MTLDRPAGAISAALMAACRLVLETNVVVRALPFHCTTEEETKFVPVTVMVKLAPAATAELGLSTAIAGGVCVIMKLRAEEVPPPGDELDTVTEAEPAALISAVEIAA